MFGAFTCIVWVSLGAPRALSSLLSVHPTARCTQPLGSAQLGAPSALGANTTFGANTTQNHKLTAVQQVQLPMLSPYYVTERTAAHAAFPCCSPIRYGSLSPRDDNILESWSASLLALGTTGSFARLPTRGFEVLCGRHARLALPLRLDTLGTAQDCMMRWLIQKAPRRKS